MLPQIRRDGFSLVELLITVAIMGILAAFTVPSLFNTPNSTANSKYNAIAKDTAHMVLTAYEQYKAANATIPTTLKAIDLTPYMNYVKIDTTSTIDYYQTAGSAPCAASSPCIVLHNGAYLRSQNAITMGPANEKASLWFDLDPDGKFSGSASGPGKALEVVLYYDGRIRTWSTIDSNTIQRYSGVDYYLNASSTAVIPPWFEGF